MWMYILIGWLVGSFFGIGQVMGFAKSIFPAKQETQQ